MGRRALEGIWRAKEKFRVKTGALEHAIGGVLSQKQKRK